MTTTMGDVAHDMYIEDMISGYNELLNDLGNCETTSDFKKKIIEINKYLKENKDFFGKDSVFMSPALLENLEAVKVTEKVLNNQRVESKNGRIYFWVGIVIAITGIAIGVLYK